MIFEQRTPPILNEQMLRAELERRKLRIQTAVAVLAGFLLMIAAAAGVLGYRLVSCTSLLCFGYIITAATGGGVIAIVYSRKGGKQHEYRCDCPVMIVLVLIILLPFIVGFFVYRDARQRNMNAILWAFVAALAPAFIGLIVYLLVRGIT